ncbi:MAG: hypothetical protein ACOX0Z_01880 [Candidatus Nanosyncoccaceae bacterium]
MNSESQISNPERLSPEQNRQSLPEVDLSLLRPNIGPEVGPIINAESERKEAQADAQAAISDISSGSVGPMVQTTPAPLTLNKTDSLSGFAVPSVAANLDVIEQGWVDVTKQVLASTVDNPRVREEKIKDLQADYLLKRYGRTPGSFNSSEETKI